MKKYLIISLIFVTMLTGCSSNKKEKDKNLIDELNNLKIEDKYVFMNMTNLNEVGLLAETGLLTEYIENFIFSKSDMEIKDFYIIVKPKKKYKEEVKNIIEAYILTSTNKKRMEEIDINTMECIDECKDSQKISDYLFKEYKGYLIYISSDNNELVFKTIKDNL